MAFGFVRELGTGNVTAGSSFTIAAPAAGVAAGDTILVKVNSGTTTVSGVTDAAGNTYTEDAHIENGASTGVSIWRAAGVAALTSGQLITVTLTAAANAAGEASEWSGFLSPSPLDQTQTSAGASLTPTTGTTGTTAQASEVAIAVLAFLRFTLTGNPTGYTALTSAVGGSGTTQQTLAAAYEILTATGTQSASWTSGTSGTYAALIVTYRGVVAAPLTGGTAGQARARPHALVPLVQLHSRAAVATAGTPIPLVAIVSGGRVLTRAATLTQISDVVSYAQAGGHAVTLRSGLSFVIPNPVALAGAARGQTATRQAYLRPFWALTGRGLGRAGAGSRPVVLAVRQPLTGRTRGQATARLAALGRLTGLAGGARGAEQTRSAFLGYALTGATRGQQRPAAAALGGILALYGRTRVYETTLGAYLSEITLEPPVAVQPVAVYTVRVRDSQTFALLCELDAYESFDYHRRFRDAGDFTLVIGNEIAQRALVTPLGTVVEFLRNGGQEFVGRVDYQRLTLDNTGEEGFKWELRGHDLTTEIYEYVTAPLQQGGTPAPDSVAAMSAAQAILHYLTSTTGPPAPAEKQKSYLKPGHGYAPSPATGDATPTLVPIGTLGGTVTYDALYEPLVSVLKALAAAGGVGWRFTLDTTTGSILLDILGGGDRTEGTASGLIPAIFSVDRDTLSTFTYEYNAAAAANALYVAGPGEIATRTVLEVLDPVSIAINGRHEAFIDAPTSMTTASLNLQAGALLANQSNPLTCTFEPVSEATLRYRQDWDLGDTVTLRLDEAALRLNAQITEVEIKAETGAEPQVIITVGPPPRDVLDLILEQQRQAQKRHVHGSYTAPLLPPVVTVPQSVGALAGQAQVGEVGSIGAVAQPPSVGPVNAGFVPPSVGSLGGNVQTPQVAQGSTQYADWQSTQQAIQTLAQAINALTGLAASVDLANLVNQVQAAFTALGAGAPARQSDTQAAVTSLTQSLNALQGMARVGDVQTQLGVLAQSINNLRGLASQADTQAAVNALKGYIDGHGLVLHEARITT